MASITFKHVEKTYPGNVTVVPDLNLEIQDKEFVILVGPSGCGKSTTLRMIAGLEDITSGELYIGDRVVNDVAPKDRDIAMVFQNYALYPHMTVYKNIAFGLTLQKIPQDEIDRRVHEAARALDLEHLLNRKPKALSGGQRQRVALGRAMVRNPAVFLLDEPLSNLDAKLRESMRFEIKEIQKNFGISVVYVTHDQSEAMAMSDRVIVINRGVIQQIGTPIEIYRNPANQFVADFLGKINFVKGEVKDGRIELTGLGQSLPYDGPRTGKVVVAVRPENIDLSLDSGDLEGRISSMFYMGDVNDCRVDINGVQVRVIADSHSYDKLYGNEKIFLRIKEFLVYEDDGNDEHTKIVT